MNIARVERMIRDRDLSRDAASYLVHCRGECEYLDFKVALHLDHDHELARIARDILAMKNVGGGYLVVGVEDKTWRIEGVPSTLSLDTKQLRDKVRKATGLDLDVDIVFHDIATGIGTTRRIGLILVRGARRRHHHRAPSVVAKDFYPREDWGLRQGEIYVRSGDTTKRAASAEELEALFEAIDQRALASEAEADVASSPFAVEDGLYRLLDRGFSHFVGRTQLRDDLIHAVTADPRIWIVNVHGPGGVGKSALVNWAVYHFYQKREFESIIHLSAKDTQLSGDGIIPLTRSLYSIENLIGHILSVFEEPQPASLEDRQQLALELLTAWKVLIVLDNMETVQDARMLNFIRAIPPDSKSKALITSRQRHGGWEQPIEVPELSVQEVGEFLNVKLLEHGLSEVSDPGAVHAVVEVTGGLPLAIEWVVGQVTRGGKLKAVLNTVRSPDSPILEFSFRNMWKMLSVDGRLVLAALPILDEPVTAQLLTIVTQLPTTRIEDALVELEQLTLVRRVVASDGTTAFSALPITLSFAANQLSDLGDFGPECRRRYDELKHQVELRDHDIARFDTVVARFDLQTPNEKKAAVLVKRADSEAGGGALELASTLYDQALSLAPTNAYILASAARFNLNLDKVETATRHAEDAVARATKPTKAYALGVLADVRARSKNWAGQVEALRAANAISEDAVSKHKLGIALSKAGRKDEAVSVFTELIESERTHTPPRSALLYALKSRSFNYRQQGRLDDARRDDEELEAVVKQYPHLA